ncbi:MAG: hypothetical protein BVN35_14400 [Proteobacteria bacterium ST_bin11]|nr:MAG: hypothetical protein BVN35_14400 [Proteobacteria bacterium ST_bin11]
MVKTTTLLKTVSALSLALFADLASAHVGYGTALYDQATNAYAGAGSGGLNPTVSSNAGWVSGLSNNGVNRTASVDTYGDSHNNRFRFFTLTQASNVSFTVTGAANTNGASVLNPGVSIFSGMVPASSHDGVGDLNGLAPAVAAGLTGSAATQAYLASSPGFASWSPFYDANDEILAAGGAANLPGNRDKWGVFKSDGNFTMGNNNGLVSGVTFIDAVADAASGAYSDGVVDNSVSWSGLLGPGTYTMTIGGASLAELTSLFTQVQLGTPAAASVDCTSFGAPGCNGTQWPGGAAVPGSYANLRLARNMDITLNVQAVPVPGAVWLFGSALAGLVGFGRRKALAA